MKELAFALTLTVLVQALVSATVYTPAILAPAARRHQRWREPSESSPH
jgi:hypothetical protein